MRADISRPPAPSPASRPRAQGKFLYVGNEKLAVRGFTYGPFAPAASGAQFPDRGLVDRDLAAISSVGANAIRVYTVPPRWLLDAAARQHLWVMVGIPWEQHVAFLDEPGLADSIEQTVRAGVRACAGHPAVLCYAVGNEIPAAVVRWSGRTRIERHVRRLYEAAWEEDPGALATYVNYPSTEYLELDFLDFVSFNVYLESVDRLAAYLKRLHNRAGDRPLLMGELGFDSSRQGEVRQATALSDQLRAVRRGGCAGAFVFSWTDEWHAGGADISDWSFGVTDRERRPKPALMAVRSQFASDPMADSSERPRVSVVVCAYNAEATLADCLRGATRIDYPDYEVIVVDDGSTDATAAIAGRFPDVRVVSTPNHGLSHARNTGIEASTGSIVAFTDADARPDRDWLTHLVASFAETNHAGIGGPNIAPGRGGPIADCVANAPGGPVHVLLSDDEAEHIPGCNMAFRRQALESIGGFDPRFRVAGDDVDVCWKIHAAGMTLGFAPAAVVWHHPRDTIGAYWRQQAGYGRAEALLEEKWPEKYNVAGHVTWGGRVYAGGPRRFLGRSRIYHGVWGGAPYQTAEPEAPPLIESLSATPEWYLVLAGLLFMGLLGLTWAPLKLAFPLLFLAAGPVITRAVHASSLAQFPGPVPAPPADRRRRWITGLLHVLQPAARLRGRVRHGLTPWRLRSARRFVWPRPLTAYVWSESWRPPYAWVAELDGALRRMRATVLSGGAFDRWDLVVKSGFTGRARIYTCAEEHGNGRQFVRFRFAPRLSGPGIAVLAVALGVGGWALAEGALFAALVLIGLGILIGARIALECGAVLSACLEATDEIEALDLRGTCVRASEPVTVRAPGAASPRAPSAVAVAAASGSAT